MPTNTRTRTVTYADHDPPLMVTLRLHSLTETHRSICAAQALVQIKKKLGLQPEDPLPGGFEKIIEARMVHTFANCMACLDRSEGFPLTISFHEFCQLPEEFVKKWQRAALDLNPHWKYVPPIRLRDLIKPPPIGETDAHE
jgi:hypothetical protein